MTCQQTVDIGACSTSGTNTTANNTNYVVQYPKPYRRTDGRWIAVGSMIGTIIGTLRNQKLIKKANAAEDRWHALTNQAADKGQWLFTTHADKLTACTDALHEKLCAVAMCGYKPDYEGIIMRVRTTALRETELARAKACRLMHRYNTGMNADVQKQILLQEMATVTTAITSAVEQARKDAFELNYKLLSNVTEQIEGDQLDRWRLGSDFMWRAGDNYAKLAESYRRSAKESIGDWATLGSTLGIIIPMMLGLNKPDAENECGTETSGQMMAGGTDPGGTSGAA